MTKISDWLASKPQLPTALSADDRMMVMRGGLMYTADATEMPADSVTQALTGKPNDLYVMRLINGVVTPVPLPVPIDVVPLSLVQSLMARVQVLEAAAPSPPPAPAGATVTTPPKFAPDGSALFVGTTVTRTVGVYANGTPVSGQRFRSGEATQVANGQSANYTYVEADAGHTMTYREMVMGANGVLLPFDSAPTGLIVPAPAPVAGLWSSDEVEMAILQNNNAPNEALMYGMNNLPAGSGGFRAGSTMSFGNEWRQKDRWFDWGGGWSYGVDEYLPWGEPWWILVPRSNATTGGLVELKDHTFQLLSPGASAWTKLKPNSSAAGWIGNYKAAGNGYDDSDGTLVTPGTGTDGGYSVALALGRAPHGTTGLGKILAGSGPFEGVLHSCLARIAPGQPAGFTACIHVGADPKLTNLGGANDKQVGAYTAMGISSTRTLTTNWQRITMVNLGSSPGSAGVDGYERRRLTLARFRAIRPSY